MPNPKHVYRISQQQKLDDYHLFKDKNSHLKRTKNWRQHFCFRDKKVHSKNRHFFLFLFCCCSKSLKSWLTLSWRSLSGRWNVADNKLLIRFLCPTWWIAISGLRSWNIWLRDIWSSAASSSTTYKRLLIQGSLSKQHDYSYCNCYFIQALFISALTDT